MLSKLTDLWNCLLAENKLVHISANSNSTWELMYDSHRLPSQTKMYKITLCSLFSSLDVFLLFFSKSFAKWNYVFPFCYLFINKAKVFFQFLVANFSPSNIKPQIDLIRIFQLHWTLKFIIKIESLCIAQ